MSTEVYYSAKRDADRCLIVYNMFKDATSRGNLPVNFMMCDIDETADKAETYANTDLPVVVSNNQQYTGQNAVIKVGEILGIRDANIPEGVLPHAVAVTTPPTHPSNTPPPQPIPTAQPISSPPLAQQPVYQPQQFPVIKRVPHAYVLYIEKDEDIGDVLIPANGIVRPECFESIVERCGGKPHNYLVKSMKTIDKKVRKPLPILVTMERNPTVWYGQAARDWCQMLCVIHGGSGLF